MSISRICRAASLFTSLTVCVFLMACEGRQKGAVVRSSAADSIDVVFQMTGLMLMVPPQARGGRTHVLLPIVGSHRARLGFGLRTNISGLCVRYTGRICYVDLQAWKVDTIGKAGAPTDPGTIGLPEGVINVTRGSGGEYRASPGAVQSVIRSHVTFAAGRATDSCSLGRWDYTPVNQMGSPTTTKRLDLVNVLYWTIRHPASQPFVLRFRQRLPPFRSVSVPLEGVADDSIMVVLAHVTAAELKYLPPDTTTGPPIDSRPTTLGHIDDLYNLLRKNGRPPPRTHRPPAHFVEPTGGACPLKVTLPPGGFVPFATGRGIKTYGCVVGSGEG